MYLDTVHKMAESAVIKKRFIQKSLLKYLILSAMAGIYVGFGIMLIFSIGAPFAAVHSSATKILMGVSFGVALTLVIFAGSELFTGNNMVMMLGRLTQKVTTKDAINIWTFSYIGNLVGSLFFAYLIAKSGLIANEPQSALILKAAAEKMNAPFGQLFIRGILCNMLVCLAIWTSTRAKEDISKLLLIWWCLFAFIGAGFEHSIANMSLLGMALFIPHDPTFISIVGFIKNLIVVTAGNFVGGTLFIGAMYWYVSKE
ncbi:formate/nitrite transporter family protein [Clostridiaceae bacterium 35-E11]